VELAPSASRTFNKLSPELRTRIEEALQELARDAPQTGRIGGKSVKTIQAVSDSFHRLRVGDDRVMYDTIDEDRVILVLGIVHRGDLERWIRSR
jgi:Cytotoxic translational repressor of toxin-antitoxin stability system